jgi:ribosome biogenesis SPOUT family RNA methylase Rps3
MLYVIDQIEPELYEWSALEYAHIQKNLPKGSQFLITNLLESNSHSRILRENDVESTSKSIQDCLENARVIVLDQMATQVLEPEDALWATALVCGGILGTDEFEGPIVNRTIEITEKLENRQVRTRHLEKAQMTSDTALIVSMKIMNGKRLDELEFIDKVFMHES